MSGLENPRDNYMVPNAMEDFMSANEEEEVYDSGNDLPHGRGEAAVKKEPMNDSKDQKHGVELLDEEELELRAAFETAFHKAVLEKRDRKSGGVYPMYRPAPIFPVYTPTKQPAFAGSKEGRKQVKLPKLPTLQEKLLLSRHLDICEALLLDEGVSMDRLGSKVAVVDTLSVSPELLNTAQSMLELSWEQLKSRLLAEFCEPNFIRDEFEARLSRLKFDPKQMVSFVHSARQLWSLRTADMDQRWFAKRLFRSVPPDLLERVVVEARRINRFVEWTSHDMSTLLELLTEAVVSRAAVYAVSREVDGVKFGREPGHAKPAAAPSSDWKSWVNENAGRLFYLKTSELPKAEEIKGRCVSWKEGRSKIDQKPYFVLAFDSKDKGLSVLKSVFPDGKSWREYVAKNF